MSERCSQELSVESPEPDQAVNTAHRHKTMHTDL